MNFSMNREMTEPEKRWLSWSIWSIGGKHSYAGTVTPAQKARQRAKNKVARKQRRINRGR